jgi:hypothetical protein
MDVKACRQETIAEIELMRHFTKNLLLLGLVLAVASPLSAADEKKKKKRQPNLANQTIKKFAKAELTDEQQAKVKALAAEHGPKIAAARKKAALSAEQKAARSKALKDNKAAGKKGKEARAAVEAASKLSDDQKAAMAETRKASGAFNAAVVALLSPEQKQKQGIKAPKKGKKKKDS